jgi:hypothetical protein
MKTLTTLALAALTVAFAALMANRCIADDALPAAPPAPDYSAFTHFYRLPYANRKPVDFDHLSSLLVRASINGGPVRSFDVDTGSVGVIVTADDVPNIDPSAPAGSILYSSSGIELDGVWTLATVSFPDSRDENGNIATAVVPVLAALQRQFHPGAVNGGNRNATTAPVKNPRVHMLGIGFGRGKKPSQELNPWVNLKPTQVAVSGGAMRRGYQITPDGIILGLTAGNVGSGYLFEKLTQRTNAPTTMPATVPMALASQKDWNASRGWVTVAGKKQQISSMLIDTGLTNMMLEFQQVTDQSNIEDGTEMTVTLLSGRLSYSFKTGDAANPLTPKKVTFVHHDGTAVVNTGLRALARFDYLYDADAGYLGLRPRPNK